MTNNIAKIRAALLAEESETEKFREALAALAELEKAATQFVAGEVADEMCDRAYISKWRGVPELIGHEPDDEDRQWAREWLEAWRAELGPTLGMVELKEPTPEECERICTEYERMLMREGTCGGRDAFDAVRAVMWPKSEGS